jgi:hypothetical protein
MTLFIFSRCLRDGEQKVIFDVDIFLYFSMRELSKLQVIYLLASAQSWEIPSSSEA